MVFMATQVLQHGIFNMTCRLCCHVHAMCMPCAFKNNWQQVTRSFKICAVHPTKHKVVAHFLELVLLQVAIPSGSL